MTPSKLEEIISEIANNWYGSGTKEQMGNALRAFAEAIQETEKCPDEQHCFCECHSRPSEPKKPFGPCDCNAAWCRHDNHFDVTLLQKPKECGCKCHHTSISYCTNCLFTSCSETLKPSNLPPEVPKTDCGVCGCFMVYIRSKVPGGIMRTVCPTCTYERLEQIREISAKDYGRTYSAK